MTLLSTSAAGVLNMLRAAFIAGAIAIGIGAAAPVAHADLNGFVNDLHKAGVQFAP
jgi:hypothetical protein